MSVSASEIDKIELRSDPRGKSRYTEEYRVKAARYYEKARKIDPKKTIKDCARELRINEKTFNDWVNKFQDAGKVTGGVGGAEGPRRGEPCDSIGRWKPKSYL